MGHREHTDRSTTPVVEEPLGKAARTTPEAVALVAPGRTLRYGELDRLVEATARHLQDLGYGAEKRIGLCLPNGWRMLVLLPAVVRAGGVACPISTRLPRQGVADRVGKVAASLLITDREDLAVPPWEGVVVMSPEAVITESGGSPKNVRCIALSHPATVVFTSGSTGEARAALHAFGNHYFSAKGSNENIALSRGDRWLLALPLYHVGGLGIVFRCLLAGSTLVVPEPEESTGEAISRYGITHLSLVATQLGRLLREGLPPDPGTMKAILLGGSAIPPSLIQEADARGWPIHTSYGMTETASQIATTPPGASLADLDTSGRVLPYRRIRVEDGEILVKGKTLFQGYVEGDTLHPSCDSEGWFHTGDLGTLSTDGFLRVHGRKDNMFISGGENIHPEEIERTLCMLDGVRQAVVVPIADATFGHRPVAFVQTSNEAPVLEELAAHLARVLPRFKIPTAFYAWPEAVSESEMKMDRAYFQRCAMQLRRENA